MAVLYAELIVPRVNGWCARVAFTDLLDSDDPVSSVEVPKIAAEAVKRLNALAALRPQWGDEDYVLQGVIAEMESMAKCPSAQPHDFDSALADLYDWADDHRVIVGPALDAVSAEFGGGDSSA